MEPVILELEREKNDVLIIAHESVLRVLYGYLMACDAMAIPKLKFPRDEIIEASPPVLYLKIISNASYRLSRLVTKMKPAASISLVSHPTSSLPHLKT